MANSEDQTLISLLNPKNWSKKTKVPLKAANTAKTELSASENFSFSSWLRNHQIHIIFLTALVFLAYFNSLGNGLVSDDKGLLEVGNLTKTSFIFADPLNFLLHLIWAGVSLFFGINPAVFRLLNIFFHLGNVLVLFIILDLLSFPTLALFGAALFSVHPLLTEGVSWISGGQYSFYSLLFLLSFLFYILKKQNYYYLSLLFFLLGLFAYNRVIPLFLAYVVYEYSFGNLRANWRKLIPYLVLSVIFAFLYGLQIGSRVSSLAAITYSSGTVNLFFHIPYSLTTYLQLLFWPQGLSFYQSDFFPTVNGAVFRSGFLAVFISVVIWSFKKNKFLFFWLSFFLINLLVTLLPFKISSAIADRYVYLGSSGIIVFAGYYLARFSLKHPRIGYLIFSLILVALLVRTITRNLDWKNTDTLAFATVKTTPTSPRAHNLVGAYYYNQRQFDLAAKEFQTTINLNPRFADAYHNLGEIMVLAKKYPEAIKLNENAVKLNPSLWQGYESLGKLFANKGDKEQALINFKKALELNPNSLSLPKLILENSR